jgi:TolB-like protein/Tfp pilus assembly protein PilF
VGFIEELKRRNVFRVGIAYVVVAWIIAQVADLVLENIDAPGWLMKTILLLLALGLPLALIFAWAFEMTPEGIKKEKDVDRSQSITPQTGRKLNALIMGLLVIAVAYFAYDKFMLRPEVAVKPAVPAPEPPAFVEEAPLEKSIAVLPFANRSNREEDEFFTEGIHDDLLTHLARIGSMKVISRTSVLRYKDTRKTIPEIAAELKVTTVLEGGIQRSGDQVRINVQLIDAKTDEHLWAEIFDRQLTAENLFAIQSEISTRIAEALQATLSPEEKSRLTNVPTTNLAAYNAYLRGRQLQSRRTSSDLERSLAEFQRATELDPGYALAWVGVAESASLLTIYGTLPGAESLALQEQAIDRALAIDGELGEAYASLAGLYENRQEYGKAESAYRRAIELSPNYAPAYQWYANNLTRIPDRLDEAVPLLEKAAELDPLSPIIRSNRAQLLEQLGRFEDAEAEMLSLIDLDPDFAQGYAALSRLYSDSLGQYAKAMEWLQVAQRKDPGNISNLAHMMEIYLHVSDYESAQAIRDQMQNIDPQHWRLGWADMALNIAQGNFAGAREGARWMAARVAQEPDLLEIVAFTQMLGGEYSEARETLRQATPGWEDPAQWDELIPSNVFDACVVAGMFAGSGDTQLAQNLVERTIDYYSDLETRRERAYPWAPVDCWIIKGDYDRALDLLEIQVANNYFAYWWVIYEWPWWDALRSDPRFQAAMQNITEKVAVQRELIDEMNG